MAADQNQPDRRREANLGGARGLGVASAGRPHRPTPNSPDGHCVTVTNCGCNVIQRRECEDFLDDEFRITYNESVHIGPGISECCNSHYHHSDQRESAGGVFPETKIGGLIKALPASVSVADENSSLSKTNSKPPVFSRVIGMSLHCRRLKKEKF